MIQNLRDVAESLELVAEQPLVQPGMLYRGGTVNNLFDETELPPVRTVFNLRKGPDQPFPSINGVHHPAQDHEDNYLTTDPRVRRWLKEGLAKLVDAPWPVLVHCTSGRDRTGVLVGLVLFVVGIDTRLILDEYELSEGVTPEHQRLFQRSIEGFEAEPHWLSATLTQRLRDALLVHPERPPHPTEP